MTTEKLEAIKARAEAYLRDAQRVENSEATRADCAFDAIYMWCRYVMSGRDEGLQHPHPDVFTGAATQLEWPADTMGPALAYMPFRDSLERLASPENWSERALSRRTRDMLTGIAVRLKAAALPTVTADGLVSIDPDIMSGMPCFTGTRVPIENVVASLDSGMTFEEVRRHYSFVTEEHVAAARKYLADT